MILTVLSEAWSELIHGIEMVAIQSQWVWCLDIILGKYFGSFVIVAVTTVGKVQIILIYLLTEYITRQQRLFVVLSIEIPALEQTIIEVRPAARAHFFGC